MFKCIVVFTFLLCCNACGFSALPIAAILYIVVYVVAQGISMILAELHVVLHVLVDQQKCCLLFQERHQYTCALIIVVYKL